MNPDDDFDQQLRVRAVFERYFSAVDQRDFELYATCFTEQVHFEFNLNPKIIVDGRDALVAKMKGLGRPMFSSHGLSNTSITIDGDAARATTFAVIHAIMGPLEGGPVLVRGLRYDDRLVREKGDWRIAERIHNPLWQFETVTLAPRASPKT